MADAPDHPRIWLEPECCADPDYHIDRCWHSTRPDDCDGPEIRECPQCLGAGYFHDATGRDFDCGFCGKTEFVSVEQEEPEAWERDE